MWGGFFIILVRSVKSWWRGEGVGWVGWGWGSDCDGGFVHTSNNGDDDRDADLELQDQMGRSMSPLDREVDEVLRQASERKRRLKNGGGVLSYKRGGKGRWLGGEKGREREKVEWENREDVVGIE